MYDLAPVVCELGRLLWRDNGDESRGGYLPWVRSEDPIDFFPDLKLRGTKTGREQGSKKVRIATPNLPEKRARDRAKEA